MQRRYFAAEIESAFPGFAGVDYPDWLALLDRLSRDARSVGWRGPLVLDEFPYLVAQSPGLSSTLQNWIDRERRQGGILLAVAGSSQRMMQSSILAASAPLYGRADEVLKIEPLAFGFVPDQLFVRWKAPRRGGMQGGDSGCRCQGGLQNHRRGRREAASAHPQGT